MRQLRDRDGRGRATLATLEARGLLDLASALGALVSGRATTRAASLPASRDAFLEFAGEAANSAGCESFSALLAELTESACEVLVARGATFRDPRASGASTGGGGGSSTSAAAAGGGAAANASKFRVKMQLKGETASGAAATSAPRTILRLSTASLTDAAKVCFFYVPLHFTRILLTI